MVENSDGTERFQTCFCSLFWALFQPEVGLKNDSDLQNSSKNKSGSMRKGDQNAKMHRTIGQMAGFSK